MFKIGSPPCSLLIQIFNLSEEYLEGLLPFEQIIVPQKAFSHVKKLLT